MKTTTPTPDLLPFPSYFFVVDGTEFEIPSQCLQEISPLFICLAHHATSRRIPLLGVNKFFFEALYEFYFSDTYPNRKIEFFAEELLQLGDYLLATEFKTYIEIVGFTLTTGGPLNNDKGLIFFKLALRYNAKIILEQSRRFLSQNLAAISQCPSLYSFNESELRTFLLKIDWFRGPVFTLNVVSIIVAYIQHHYNGFQRHTCDQKIVQLIQSCPYLYCSLLPAQAISYQAYYESNRSLSYPMFILGTINTFRSNMNNIE